MKKIISSIENALTKAEAKIGRPAVATIRRDVVNRAIERGEFEELILAYSYSEGTDTEVQNKLATAEPLLQRFGWGLRPDCWVDPKIHLINGKECYEISIRFHSNLSYDMYVPVAV